MKKITKIFSIFLSVIALSFLMRTLVLASTNNGYCKSEATNVQQILAMLKTEIDSEKSHRGNNFSVKIMDAIYSAENNILISKGSALSGHITKVKKANFFCKDPYIRLSINFILSADGKAVILEQPFETEIYTPNSKRFKEKMFDNLPTALATSGSSFFLGQASSLAKDAVWGISTSSGIVVGIISGIIAPAKDKTIGQTCASRAFCSSQEETIKTIMHKGKNFRIESGQFINIYLDKENIELIQAGI